MSAQPSDAGTIAIVGVSRRGLEISRRIQARLGGDVWTFERIASEASAIDPDAATPAPRAFPEHGIRDALKELFPARSGIVLVLPVGAAVRLLAPLLSDKHADPAVVAVDEGCRFAVSLLSGHGGGANALARQVAAAIDAQPVVTTAAEALDTIALDLLGRERGWTIEDTAALTRASAAMIARDPIGAYQDAGEEDWWRQVSGNVRRYNSLEALAQADVAARLVISDGCSVSELGSDAPLVVYRPRTLFVGVGCVRGASADEIEQLALSAIEEHGLARQSICSVATIDAKADEQGIVELAARWGVPLSLYTPNALARVDAPSGPSEIVAMAIGAPAVCEPAALLAAGPAATMVIPKTRTNRVTVAVARATASPALGSLTVVGLGPGSREHLTERARRALEQADVVVGYTGYVELVRPWLKRKEFQASPIGAEVDRCRLAISLWREGRHVALVSSGDAGIYGTAGIVFELMAEMGQGDESAGIEVIPGVSAASSAAALLGAPLMSDFAAISLSDLMTPWETIERRIEAVAASDMVVALYNPASQRRREGIRRAFEILRGHRDPRTPVGLVRNAGREDERVVITDLEHAAEQQIDMMTIVLVGNSATIRVGDRVVTRRGYTVRS